MRLNQPSEAGNKKRQRSNTIIQGSMLNLNETRVVLILLTCANIILHPKTEQLLIVLHSVDLYGDKYLFSFKDLFSLVSNLRSDAIKRG